jgi:hypothetical protein
MLVVRTVFCPVMCGFFICLVLRNLQRINNTSKGGLPTSPLRCLSQWTILESILRVGFLVYCVLGIATYL